MRDRLLLCLALAGVCPCIARNSLVTHPADVSTHDPAPPVKSFQIYFGNGCFWGRQHMFAEDLERKLLGRKDSEITAVGGYAGAAKAGPGGRLCYYNANSTDVYSDLGHAEVVAVELRSAAEVQAAARVYFTSFVEVDTGVWAREDIYDEGLGYRALIGLPGGLASPLLPALRAANLHNMTLQGGEGSDADTFGTNKVYIMDSARFPFHQAELCLQFHNNQTSHYPPAYHHLRRLLAEEGRLHPTGCPDNYICNTTAAADAELSSQTHGATVWS